MTPKLMAKVSIVISKAWNSVAPAPGALLGVPSEIILGEVVGQQQWVMVSPYGEFPNQAGHQVFRREDAAAIVADFNSTAARLDRSFRGLPFYIGHPDADPETYRDSKAYGWIKQLEARKDGLWALVKWSNAGRELVKEGHFQFCSPYWLMKPSNGRRGSFHPNVLVSVGFTNRPNITGSDPLGANTLSAAPAMMNERWAKLRSVLGVSAEAGMDAIISAAEELRRQLSAALGTVAANDERWRGERNARIADLVQSAVSDFRILEAARREWTRKLVENFDASSRELVGRMPCLNASTRLSRAATRCTSAAIVRGEPGDIHAINAAVARVQVQAGSPGYDEAFEAVRRHPANAAIFQPAGAARNDE